MAYGGEVIRVEPVHGKRSTVTHLGSGCFAGLPSPLEAGRYHSLAVSSETLPEVLEVTATAPDGLVMGDAPPRAPGRGHPVPPRVDPHRRRHGHAGELAEVRPRRLTRPVTVAARAHGSVWSGHVFVLRPTARLSLHGIGMGGVHARPRASPGPSRAAGTLKPCVVEARDRGRNRHRAHTTPPVNRTHEPRHPRASHPSTQSFGWLPSSRRSSSSSIVRVGANRVERSGQPHAKTRLLTLAIKAT